MHSEEGDGLVEVMTLVAFTKGPTLILFLVSQGRIFIPSIGLRGNALGRGRWFSRSDDFSRIHKRDRRSSSFLSLRAGFSFRQSA